LKILLFNSTLYRFEGVLGFWGFGVLGDVMKSGCVKKIVAINKNRDSSAMTELP
jgi:hypothetical protein